MKKLHIAILTLFLILFSGCSTSLNKVDTAKINPALQAPKNIKTLSTMDSVGFEWGLVDDLSVDGFNIYRSSPDEQNKDYLRVGTVKDRYSTHYLDEGLQPNSQYFYQIASYDKSGNESQSSEIIKVKTEPFDAIPFVEAISNYPRKVKIIWRPYPNPRVKEYIIERSDLGSTKWREVGTVKGRLNVEYIDDGLKDNTPYQYRVIAQTYNGLKSPPSKAVEAITKPLPQVVQDIKATKDLPKRIDISWSPISNKDIDHYIVYRSEKSDGSFTDIMKTKDTKYTDPISKDGQEFFYKITAVDTVGLESPMPTYPTLGASLGLPSTPVITSATIENKKVVIRWSTRDDRAKSFIVTRTSGSWYKKEQQSFDGINGNVFIDENVIPGIEYSYTVSSVDAYGIVSEPTKNAVLLLPENLGN